MTLAIAICATKNFTYAMCEQARRIVAALTGEGPPAPPPPEFLVDVKAVDANGANREVELAVRLVPKVTIAATDAKAAERTGGDGHFQITRTGSLDNPLTVSYTIGGTATNGTAYNTISNSVTIPANQTSATIPVTVKHDALVEGIETVILTLSADSPVYAVGSPSTATVQILDLQATLQSVNFWNGYTVYQDPTVANPNGVAYASPQWVAGQQGPAAPYAYNSSLYPLNKQLNTQFVANVPAQWQAFYPNTQVRALGTSGYDLTPQGATVAGTTLKASNVAVNAFAKGAQYFPSFTLNWQLSFDAGTTWVGIGSSVTPLYVTWNEPQATRLYRTILDVGTQAAAGQVDSNDVLWGIWSKFLTLSVSRWDGTGFKLGGGTDTGVLVYNQKLENIFAINGIDPREWWDNAPYTAAQLLIYGHGNCVAWSDFFSQVLLAQGFVGALPTTIVPSELGVNGILVNGWVFGAPDNTLPNASDGFKWAWPGNNLTEKDALATPGQGFAANQSADVYFVLHKVVLIDGEIYDTSYGAL